jgi:hypothetical protein
MAATRTMPVRTVGEWELRSGRTYENPFTDVTVDAAFTAPSGATVAIPGFYDGDGTWRVRFNPGEPGEWTYRIAAYPENPDLAEEGIVTVTPRATRGFLRATPGEAWGFRYEDGTPVFVFGDTVYNLFGMAHCGNDVVSFLERRAAQGFNLLRVRVPVSPFHPPDGYNTWQTCRTWPWGGSEQAPRFDRFNLAYFRTVDAVVREAERLGIGLEVIMEAWGFEFPFNSRNIFVPEWEELWLRYLIARYDAFNCVAMWTPMNEYEYYPNGDWHYKPVADRWAMRIGRFIKRTAGHGHIVAIHNGPREPAFAERFKADPGAIDAVMYQEWGTRDRENGWLAAGIEEKIEAAFAGWWGSAVFAEWGYERNPAFDLLLPPHEFCDAEHTRRGAWHGAFCGMGIVHGFENSWGPWLRLDEDQPGMEYLLHVRRFFTEIVSFDQMRPNRDLLPSLRLEDSRYMPAEYPSGKRPLAITTPERDVVAVYLPVGGTLALKPTDDMPWLKLPPGGRWHFRWFDPRTGEMPRARAERSWFFTAPEGEENGHPHDWVLVVARGEGSE